MQTTRIDTLNLGSEAIDILKRAFLYDDATLADGTADDIAGLPSGLKIRKDRVQNMPRAWRKPNERIRESREACRERVLPHNRKAENDD